MRPAIADVTVTAETVRLDILLALEPMIAGIDLALISNTDEAPEAAAYDALRALTPEALEAAFREVWPELKGGFKIDADGPVTPEIARIKTAEVGEVSMPRFALLSLEAALPPGEAPVTVGWQASFGPLVVRQTEGGADAYSGFLTGGAVSAPLPRQGIATEGILPVFGRYVVQGVLHIVPLGLDHILFVLGLFFFALQLGPLLWQVTAFTLAHTATLALASLGIVAVPASVVEPLIAASIAYIAAENILGGQLGLRRIAVVFGFGLLHGLGFASVLSDLGLQPARFATGLIGFNIGVEIGQLAVLAVAFLAVGYWFGRKPWYRQVIAIPASVAIGIMGLYWTIERLVL